MTHPPGSLESSRESMGPSSPHPEWGVPSPFVGRATELTALSDLVRAIQNGTSRFACIVGEPGIGKTRLAEELCARSDEPALGVSWGRCADSHSRTPFWPWRQVFRGSRDAELSALAERLGAPGAADDEARADAFDSVSDALARAAAREPRLLVFDDLHWCDVPSVRLLCFVARTLRDARLLVLTTWRDTDLDARPELARAIHQLARDSQRHQLGGLEVAAIAEYLGVCGDDSISPALLHQRTAGNPFFLRELIAVTARSGRAPGLPMSVRAATSERLELLPEQARAVLDGLAVAGGALSAVGLAAISRLEEQVVKDAIASAERIGIVHRRGAEPPAFFHDVVRESIYTAISARRRRELHVATAVVLSGGANVSQKADLIAHHYLAADDPASRADAVSWGRRAARDALSRGAYETAAELLSRLLTATESTGDDTHAVIAAELAEALMHAGDREQAVKGCEHAASLARACGSARALGMAALARGIHAPQAHVDRQHIALLEEALSALDGSEQGLRAQVMARLASALQPSDTPEYPLTLAREAMALARQLGQPEALARTLSLARGTFRPLEDLQERIAIDEESLALAEKLHDRRGQATAHQRLVLERLESGEADKAAAHGQMFSLLAEQLGSRRLGAQSVLLSAMQATLAGEPAAAKKLWEQGAALWRAVGTAPFEPISFQRLVLARWWGSRQALEEAAFDSWSLSMTLQVLRGNALLALGRVDETRDLVESALARGIHSKYLLLIAVAEPCAAVGTPQGATLVYQALLPFRARHIVWWGSSGGCDGSIERLLGLLAARMGDSARARRHFERALAANLQLGAPVLVARTREDYARLLLESGPDSEARELGSRLLEQAASAYEARQMALDCQRIKELTLGEQRVSRTVAPVDPGPTRTIEAVRTGAVWTVRSGTRRAVVVDGDGLRYLAYLLERPDVDVHVLELVGQSRARRSAVQAPVEINGDVGPALDAQAKAEYRKRITDLGEELEQAKAWSDRGRVEALMHELERLNEALTTALGLGGRNRPQKAAAERARANVTQRIRHTIAKIEEQDSSLGHVLDRAVRTGTFCRYSPLPRA